MNNDEGDSTLPPLALKSVDNAFNKAARSLHSALRPKPTAPNRVSSAVSGTANTGGGFLVDTHDTGGGFLLGDDEDESIIGTPPTHIPLSRIPYALDLLNLPSNDLDVLNVFNNAAEGWSKGSSRRTQDNAFSVIIPDSDEKYVSRSDWRAVCSALLPPSELESNSTSAAGDDGVEDTHMELDNGTRDETTGGFDSSLSEISDEYDDGDDDEYQEDIQPRKRARLGAAKSKGKAKLRCQDVESEGSSPARKKSTKTRKPKKPRRSNRGIEQECAEAFRLFFSATARNTKPDNSFLICTDCGMPGHDSLPDCMLTVDDVTRAMKSVGEKFTAEDVKEMVSLFTDEKYASMQEPIMSFSTFKQMMANTNLV